MTVLLVYVVGAVLTATAVCVAEEIHGVGLDAPTAFFAAFTGIFWPIVVPFAALAGGVYLLALAVLRVIGGAR